MNEHDPRWPLPSQPWHPPSPYVTHADMAPVHNKIGSLEQGQASIVSTYTHLRGEMLHGFDELKAIIRAAQTAPPAASSAGITLTLPMLTVIIVAVLLAGIIISRVPGIENLIGGS